MQHHAYYRPGRTAPEERNFPGTWEQQVEYVKVWLECVKREYEAPDLWRQLQQGVAELPASGGENTPFTPDERAQIERQLRAALEAVRRNHELTSGQLRALKEKVDDLIEAARRLGQLDWRSTFIGAMLEVALANALSSDVLRDLLGLTLGLAQLFGGPEIPALPPA
jgi:hypothetical protein